MWGYTILDFLFLAFHTALIVFNLFGWAWKPTRKANLVTLLLTGASWFLLGLWYGVGFCPLTEWHFQVLEKLGHRGLPVSYVKYLADRLTGLDFDPGLVDTLTAACFGAALVASVVANRRWIRGGFRVKTTNFTNSH
ncbi:MAG: DUF2784 domain-containing protein [Acidobacteria bacterium]|nr:DUF2784 domain-containing protein [Acidobacteriota bacterium]